MVFSSVLPRVSMSVHVGGCDPTGVRQRLANLHGNASGQRLLVQSPSLDAVSPTLPPSFVPCCPGDCLSERKVGFNENTSMRYKRSGGREVTATSQTLEKIMAGTRETIRSRQGEECPPAGRNWTRPGGEHRHPWDLSQVRRGRGRGQA